MTTPSEAPWADVRIERDPSGVVTVVPAATTTGTAGPGAVRGAAIDANGGTLLVDVTEPDQPPYAVLFDPYWSYTWLGDVYGAAVVDTVKQLVASDTTGPVRETASRGYLADVVVRLGVATWLHRWWPADNPDLPPLDGTLLELEIGALRWLAEAVYVELEPAAELLEPHLEQLPDLLGLLLAHGTGVRGELLHEGLTLALRASVDAVPADTPGHAACLAALERVDAVEVEVARDPLDWSELVRLLAPATPAGQKGYRGADRAGAPGPAVPAPGTRLRSGTATADHRDLPPRAVADVPDNVSWDLVAGPDGTRLVVRALAASHLVAPPDDPLLRARAFFDGAPRLLDLHWTLDPDGPAWAGETTVPAGWDQVQDVRVGVFHPDWAGRARVSPAAADRARAEHAEVVAILAGRVASFPARLAGALTGPAGQRPTMAEVFAHGTGWAGR